MENDRTLMIEWSIPEEQWDKARKAVKVHAARSDYDRRRLGLSLMDLGVALADAHMKEAFVPGGVTTYEQYFRRGIGPGRRARRPTASPART